MKTFSNLDRRCVLSDWQRCYGFKTLILTTLNEEKLSFALLETFQKHGEDCGTERPSVCFPLNHNQGVSLSNLALIRLYWQHHKCNLLTVPG